jgi:hypothetical protein
MSYFSNISNKIRVLNCERIVIFANRVLGDESIEVL